MREIFRAYAKGVNDGADSMKILPIEF